VADEMVARLEQSGYQLRVLLEVDTLHGRARRKPRPVEDHELEAIGERLLSPPCQGAVRDAPVNEHEPFHGRF
jgi:hypothetical protein